MFKELCEAFISVQPKLIEAAKEVALILQSGKVAQIIVEEYDEAKEAKNRDKARTIAQNRMIYKIYGRIAKTLYGGDESHARNECKLRVGCRILYRDSESFAKVFEDVIRPLEYEKKLSAMTLISVSSIMETPQATEYIKTMMAEYSQKGVYFLDLEGAQDYVDYPEAGR